MSERAVPVAIFETDAGKFYSRFSLDLLILFLLLYSMHKFSSCRNNEVLFTEVVQDFIGCRH